jgi:hypothetical protein
LPKKPPKAVVHQDPSSQGDPFKMLKERPGIKIYDVARRRSRER